MILECGVCEPWSPRLLLVRALRWLLRASKPSRGLVSPRIPSLTHGPYSSLSACSPRTGSFVSSPAIDNVLVRQRLYLAPLVSFLIAIASAADFDKGQHAYQNEDYAVALAEFSILAEAGHVEAQRFLGLMYLLGDGVLTDHCKAVHWFRKSAEKGDVESQSRLGVLLTTGTLLLGPICTVPQDLTEAAKWFHRAAEQGDVLSQKGLAQKYMGGLGVPQDYTEAAKWYRMAAEQGDVGSQAVLGGMYHQGQGVPQDYREAARWIREAAQQGWVYSQFQLGVMYHQGKGVPQDHTEAAKWYRMGAEQGYADSQAMLGGLYFTGEGVLQDFAEALKCFRKAAEQGEVAASHDALILMYELGLGVPVDYVAAYAWANRAAAKGHSYAKEARDGLLSKMTRTQIEAAQRLSRDLGRLLTY